MTTSSDSEAKFPQLQWQLPAVPPSYSPESLQQAAYSNGRDSASAPSVQPGKISWQAPVPSRAVPHQTTGSPASRQERIRPRTSGPTLVKTRASQHRSVSGDGSRLPARQAGPAAKVEWALPETISPAKSNKAGQKLAQPGRRLSSGTSASTSSTSEPATLVGTDGIRRPSSSGNPAHSSPDTAKWARLQALKQQRSSHVRAVLEAGRSPSAESSAMSSPSIASDLPSPSPSPSKRTGSIASQRRVQQPPRRPPSQQTAASQDLSEVSALSSAAAQLQNERLAAAAEAAPREDGQPLITCQGCSRSFVPSAYERHANICAKVFQTKRKAYDMVTARAPEVASDGTFGDAPPQRRMGKSGRTAAGRRASGGGGAAPQATSKQLGGKSQPKWKAQSALLRAAMAAGRAGGDAHMALAAPPGPDPSLVPCPHCGRRFNDKAAERHIPRCQDIVAKPTRLKAGSGRGAHVST